MRLKVLLTGRDKFSQEPDAELLRSRGFLVYRCDEHVINDMIEEVRPDVLIINPVEDQPSATNLYQRILKSIKYATLPLIYTLSEDDTYIVNSKRNTRNKKSYIVDNIIDGIKTALTSNNKGRLNNLRLKVAP
ncbi:MAG TPA: hypothetical protein VIN07_14595 [Flavipsychrobacter sp.]